MNPNCPLADRKALHLADVYKRQPLDRCSEQGIVVFNTPGANANAVAELVIGMPVSYTHLCAGKDRAGRA